MSSQLEGHVKWGILYGWLGEYLYQANRICVMDGASFREFHVDLLNKMCILSSDILS